jgi:hypothetical protein
MRLQEKPSLRFRCFAYPLCKTYKQIEMETETPHGRKRLGKHKHGLQGQPMPTSTLRSTANATIRYVDGHLTTRGIG